MKKASNFAFLSRKRKNQESEESKPQQMAMQNFGGLIVPKTQQDLNVFVVTFDGMKNAEQNLSGGDPYECKKCHAILNKFSKVLSSKEYNEDQSKKMKLEIKEDESYWQCEFCLYPNILKIEREQIPKKDDVVYMLQSPLENQVTQNDSTIVFCIDTSGSMNTTSQIEGKVDLKYGISQEQIEMLKQFMQPGDQAQFNFLPGNQNKNKTFISRKQCILSAIQNQLQQLKKVDPLKKVGFITFNNEVTVFGDGKGLIVNILGDKLYKKQQIINSLANFKMVNPLGESFESLINSLSKTEAKGQTALGPALVSAIEVASKGSPGSSVVLCTDGLANIGVGSLDPFDESCSAFYKQLAQVAKQKNIVVNLITIKGQGAKIEVIGQLAKDTNGNIKVVNPQKLQDDFANVLKDEVVGLNVSVKIMLHKAMTFRNQNQEFLKDNKTVMIKQLPNATINTRVSFEYELREEQDLKFMQIDIEKLKKVPFQSQIIYTSPKGGKFLRVISSQSLTTTEKEEMKKDANIGVVHQRITSNTAALFSKGQSAKSMQYNDMWSNYLNNEFQEEKYLKQQETFNTRNRRLQNAMQQRHYKMSTRMPEKQQCSNPMSFGSQQQQISFGNGQERMLSLQQNINSNNNMGAFSNQQQMQMAPSSFASNLMPPMCPPPPQIICQVPNQANKSDISLGGLSNISEMNEQSHLELSPLMQQKPMMQLMQKEEALDSDEEEQQLMENMMEKQCFNLD